MIRKAYPSGAAPYSAALISLSVPSTPTRSTFTRTPRPSATSDTDGFASSSRCTLLGRPGTTAMAFIGFSALLKKFRGERRPACLMARADAGAGVAVEVLVKWNEVVPVRIGLKQFDVSEHRAAALLVVEKRARETTRDVGGDLPQRHHAARPCRTFHLVVVAEIVV